MAKGQKKGRAKKPARAADGVKPKKTTAKKPEHVHTKLPGVLALAWQAVSIMAGFWKPFTGIFLIYLAANLLLASGLSVITANIAALREQVTYTSKFSQAWADFGSLASGAGWTGSDSSSALQSILFIIASLAFIWALRHLLSGEKITVKQAYYEGMAPLVPFILLIFLIILQVLPMTLGAAVLGIVATGAFGSVATVLFAAVFLLLTTWTLYMLSCSVIALYIATLPNMQPRQALASSKNLIRGRRWPVMRRLIFLPVLLFLTLALIFIPILLVVPPLAAPLFFILSALSVFAVHTYLYNLYRKLLA